MAAWGASRLVAGQVTTALKASIRDLCTFCEKFAHTILSLFLSTIFVYLEFLLLYVLPYHSCIAGHHVEPAFHAAPDCTAIPGATATDVRCGIRISRGPNRWSLSGRCGPHFVGYWWTGATRPTGIHDGATVHWLCSGPTASHGPTSNSPTSVRRADGPNLWEALR